MGILDLSWIPNDAYGGIKSAPATSTTNNGETSDNDDDSSTTIGEQDNKASVAETEQQPANVVDADMDVADDVDQWL